MLIKIIISNKYDPILLNELKGLKFLIMWDKFIELVNNLIICNVIYLGKESNFFKNSQEG